MKSFLPYEDQKVACMRCFYNKQRRRMQVLGTFLQLMPFCTVAPYKFDFVDNQALRYSYRFNTFGVKIGE